MSVSQKRKRKIMFENTEYLWYIWEDRYYDGAFFNDYGTPFSISVVSADKSFILSAPINSEKPYILAHISKSNYRMYLPFDVPEVITPKFVLKLITWVVKSINSD